VPTGGDAPHSDVINEFAKSANLLHVEPAGDGKTVKMTFDILMRKNMSPEDLTSRLAEINGVAEVILVASKNDVDY
jgi:hypothetical protein